MTMSKRQFIEEAARIFNGSVLRPVGGVYKSSDNFNVFASMWEPPLAKRIGDTLTAIVSFCSYSLPRDYLYDIEVELKCQGRTMHKGVTKPDNRDWGVVSFRNVAPIDYSIHVLVPE